MNIVYSVHVQSCISYHNHWKQEYPPRFLVSTDASNVLVIGAFFFETFSIYYSIYFVFGNMENGISKIFGENLPNYSEVLFVP